MQPSPESGAPRPRALTRDVVILGLVLLALSVPFLNQGLIIDDGNFVDQAQQIRADPAAPYSFKIHFAEPQGFFRYFANPPGQAYYLALAIQLFGLSDLVLHLACLPFAALAVFATYFLARELTGRGLFAALLLLATPAFLISSHTLMADVSTAGFYVLAVLLFVRGVERDSLRTLVGAGVAAGLAGLLKYSALSVLPLMLLYPLLRRRFSFRTLTAPLIGGLFFAAWCWASLAVYGEVHLLRAVEIEKIERTLLDSVLQVAAAVAGAGAATIFPPLLLAWCIAAAFARSRFGGVCTLTLAAGAFAAALPDYAVERLGYDLSNRILGGLFLAAGTAAAAFAVVVGVGSLRRVFTDRTSPEHAQRLLLVAWFLGFLVMDARLVFATPKYLLPALAPLVLLLIWRPGSDAEPRPRPVWSGAVLATTLALGVCLSLVSAAQGNAHRRAVLETVPELAGDKEAWFTGHWTVRHYSERAGHRYLASKPKGETRNVIERYERMKKAGREWSGPPPQPLEAPVRGDVVFVVEDAVAHNIPPFVERKLKEIDRRTVPSPVPLLLANLDVEAGYWAHVLGVMPYVFSTEPLSTVVIYRAGR